MKRYGMRTFTRGYESIDTMIEVEDGEWVRYEHVEKLQAAAAKELHIMQLSAISTAAMCNTPETHKAQEIDESNPYATTAYFDVMRRVKSEMNLRTELAATKELLKQVFGDRCANCLCFLPLEPWCDLLEREIHDDEGDRGTDCPYLPFEETK